MSEVATTAFAGGKFLGFFLGDEEYGVEILKVREIIGLLPITRVPRTPQAVRGVINLRGKVIPVVDLRAHFDMEPGQDTERTCIVVVQAHGTEFGLVVDRVSEVASIDAADVEAAPEFGARVDTGYLLGMAKTEGRVRLLLDLDRVLSVREVNTLAQMGGEA
jgi:purine-binding chemotaxis protein CheW